MYDREYTLVLQLGAECPGQCAKKGPVLLLTEHFCKSRDELIRRISKAVFRAYMTRHMVQTIQHILDVRRPALQYF